MTALRLIAGCLLMALAPACGADGTPAPRTQAPLSTCPTIDERLAGFRDVLAGGQLNELADVLERLRDERDGARLEHALQLALGVLQSFPRDAADAFPFDLIEQLVGSIREPLGVVLRALAQGPDSSREVFPALSESLVECPRESFLLTVRDLLHDTALQQAAGGALSDATVVSLLAHIPDQPEEGRDGFIALVRAAANAVRSPNFDFGQIRDLLSFLQLDEPPVSDLLTALQAYLQGESLDHLRATLACLDSVSAAGRSGLDQVGGLLYDLLTLEGLDFGTLLSLAGPILEQIQAPGLQTLGGAALDALIADPDLRDLAVELVVFLIRADNLVPVLDSLVVLVESRGLDDLLSLVEGLTVHCPEQP